MIAKPNPLWLAALGAVGLGWGQIALAADHVAPAAPAAAAAPAAPVMPAAPSAPPALMTPDQEARARMEQRWTDAAAERDRRYEELRKCAAKLGFEMPEAPWQQSPQWPDMPPLERPARLTPEERIALREKRWEEMRARAAQQGIEWPETPPWKAAQQRRQQLRERFDQYRATLDQLSTEQKQALEALYGPLPSAPDQVPPFGMPGPAYGWGPGWDDCPQHPGRNCGCDLPGYPPMMPRWLSQPTPPAAPQPPAAPSAPASPAN